LKNLTVTLNHQFPNDNTKVCAEIKAAKAWQAKVTGLSQESIYANNFLKIA
jgi:hypothetical protein